MNKLDQAYAPPQANIQAQAEMYDGMDASSGTRFANLIIDGIFRLVIAVGIGVVCGLAGLDMHDQGITFAFGLLTILAYYVVLEGLFGFTIGKLITGTRVVATDGSKPKFMAIVGRSLARFVPFEPFSFLGNTSGWHDRWSGTRVVRVRR